MLACVCTSACASPVGWQLSDARSCAPKAPPRVCVVAEPDHGHVIALGDVELLPGECVVADDDAKPGLLRVQTRARTGETRGRWLSTPRGKATVLAVEADGKLRADRRGCQDTPMSLTER